MIFAAHNGILASFISSARWLCRKTPYIEAMQEKRFLTFHIRWHEHRMDMNSYVLQDATSTAQTSKVAHFEPKYVNRQGHVGASDVLG